MKTFISVGNNLINAEMIQYIHKNSDGSASVSFVGNSESEPYSLELDEAETKELLLKINYF